MDVVGEVSGESLLEMGTSGCSRDDIPSDIPADQLSPVNSRRLNIYANIGKLYTLRWLHTPLMQYVNAMFFYTILIEAEATTTQTPATTTAVTTTVTAAQTTTMSSTTTESQTTITTNPSTTTMESQTLSHTSIATTDSSLDSSTASTMGGKLEHPYVAFMQVVRLRHVLNVTKLCSGHTVTAMNFLILLRQVTVAALYSIACNGMQPCKPTQMLVNPLSLDSYVSTRAR